MGEENARMENAFKRHLFAVFEANGRSITQDETETFLRLTEEMLRVNQGMNLTAIVDPKEIFIKHYVDCASLCDVVPSDATVADVGAGAGFPTLPLSILRPDLKITAIDSTEKRMRYVMDTARFLGLNQIRTRTGRAEELGKQSEYREMFDFVTARAVAPLNVLCELCIPLIRTGGLFCALKATGGREELAQAEKAAEVLGARLKDFREFILVDPEKKLSEEALKRTLIVFEKICPTPDKYPRRYARIQSDPL